MAAELATQLANMFAIARMMAAGLTFLIYFLPCRVIWRTWANVATLPGIVTALYAMPDLHLGYGFPIGGVAATNPAAGGVVSPGGVGFDISCGVRLLAASLERNEVMPVLGTLMDQLAAAVPRGRAGEASGTLPAPGRCRTCWLAALGTR